MTQPPENGPDEQTQPYGALPPAAPEPEPVIVTPPQQPVPAQPKSSNTRTILEIVGAVVAVCAIFMAGALGFGMGWFASTHHRSNGDTMRMQYFGDGQNDRGGRDGQPAPGMPDFRDFFGQGDGNGGGSGNGGSQSMPQLPEELQKWLEQFGQGLESGNGFGPGQGQGQGPQNGPGSPAPSGVPTPAPGS